MPNCDMTFPLIGEQIVQTVFRDGAVKEERLDLLVEHNMDVFLGDRAILHLTCIAQYLEELVMGRLYTDGWIHSPREVEQLQISPDGTRVQVILAADVPVDQRPQLRRTPLKPIPWTDAEVFHLADSFAMEMPLHRKTWSTHSCFLAKSGETLFFCEDIGRHNAMDKAIGYGLMHGIDLASCMIYSSGRVPTDMAMKVIQAGIPVMCSKGAATDKSIALAREYDLTLICSARKDSFRILNRP